MSKRFWLESTKNCIFNCALCMVLVGTAQWRLCPNRRAARGSVPLLLGLTAVAATPDAGRAALPLSRE
jgi:hypothetical protein